MTTSASIDNINEGISGSVHTMGSFIIDSVSRTFLDDHTNDDVVATTNDNNHVFQQEKQPFSFATCNPNDLVCQFLLTTDRFRKDNGWVINCNTSTNVQESEDTILRSEMKNFFEQCIDSIPTAIVQANRRMVAKIELPCSITTTNTPTTNTVTTVPIQSSGPVQFEESIDNQDRTASLGKSILISPRFFEVTCIQPRGKFLLYIHEHGFQLVDPKLQCCVLIVPANSLQDVVLFPKPEDCKNSNTSGSISTSITKNRKNIPPSTDMILFVFRTSNVSTETCASNETKIKSDSTHNNQILFKNKPIQQICFQLPSLRIADVSLNISTTEHVMTQLDNVNNSSTDDDPTMDCTNHWMIIFSKSINFPLSKMARVFRNPKLEQQLQLQLQRPIQQQFFVSNSDENISSTTSGMPYIRCHSSIHDGVLYPMEEGILFYKPAQYYPRRSLHAISCSGRGGSRFIDLTIQVVIDTKSSPKTKTTSNTNNKANEQNGNSTTIRDIEFTNINKVEEMELNKYIHTILIPAMERDVTGSSTTGINTTSDTYDFSSTSNIGGDLLSSTNKRKANLQSRETNKRISMMGVTKNANDDCNDRDDVDESDEEDDEDFENVDDDTSNDESSDDFSDDDDDDSDFEDVKIEVAALRAAMKNGNSDDDATESSSDSCTKKNSR